MSYPEPRYAGSAGEVSASIRAGDATPDLTYPSGTRVHYLASGASTDAKFGLYRWDMGTTPGGLGRHFHKTISESFFVLSGTVRLFDGEVWTDASPGDLAWPRWPRARNSPRRSAPSST